MEARESGEEGAGSGLGAAAAGLANGEGADLAGGGADEPEIRVCALQDDPAKTLTGFPGGE